MQEEHLQRLLALFAEFVEDRRLEHRSCPPKLKQKRRDVVSGWYAELGQGSVTLLWRDKAAPGGLHLVQLGEPPKHLVEADGMLLASREIKQATST